MCSELVLTLPGLGGGQNDPQGYIWPQYSQTENFLEPNFGYFS